MTGNQFDVVAFNSPFKRPTSMFRAYQGMSITDIIREADIDPAMLVNLQVTISTPSGEAMVPMRSWRVVRPKSGTHVQIAPVVHGALIAPLLSTILAAAAPTIAGALFPALAAAGGLGIALATAGVAVIGSLLIRALIPPPSQASSAADDPVFNLTAASNTVSPYEPYPSALGRHIMYPRKSAIGFTEVDGGEIYLRERMTFGYGPVAISDLRIGTTPITEFEGIEVEFLNVDETLTKAAMPLIDGVTKAWRTGTDAMTLYPDDIAEDNYSVLLEANTSVVRQTRVDTLSASIDISFNGLVTLGSDTRKYNGQVDVLIEYQEVGASGWTVHETKTCVENTTAYVRFTSTIEFPSEGQYSIRLTRQTADSVDTSVRDLANLTAIRSVQAGELPSHADIAEIAVRIKASNELNGQLQNLNAIVQQLAPVYDGTSWSAPQPVRHPAWIYAAALTGPQLRDAVDYSRLDADALKAWADEEPHWTCDMLIEGVNRLADVLDYICATGRARRGLTDLKYSVIRDGGAGPIVQTFTPRNSWGFSGRRYLDREIHAFRTQVVSEYKGWAVDEVVVYNDGYDASTATEIETLSLPGVVIAVGDGIEGNAYRLARYHMAVATLRPEEFSFSSDLDHVVCQMGDKIRFVHDVPLFGIGSGRVTDVTNELGRDLVHIDEMIDPDGVNYRMTIRKSSGSDEIATARSTTAGTWQIITGDVSGVTDGDLVVIEKMGTQTVELLITGITHTDELQARITAVSAAPEVLTAATGTIPAYDPLITTKPIFGPTQPGALSLRSGRDTAQVETDLSLTPRAGVEMASVINRSATVIEYGLRWRKDGSTQWRYGAMTPWAAELFTGPLETGALYYVEVASFDDQGRTLGWVLAGSVTAGTIDNVLPAPVWSSEAGVDTISLIGPKTLGVNIMEYRVYAATASSTALTLIGHTSSPTFVYRPPSVADPYTRYKVVVVDHDNSEGTYSAFINVVPTGVTSDDLSSEVQIDIDAALAAVDAAEDARDAAELAEDNAEAARDIALGASVSASDSESTVLSLVTATLPEDFSEGGRYWTSDILGSPDTVTDSPVGEVEYLTTADGPIARIDLSNAGNKVVATKGVAPLTLGRTYRIKAKVRQSGAGPIQSHLLQSRYLGDDYTSEGAPDTTYTPTALDTWEIIEHEFTPTQIAEIYVRPLMFSAFTSGVSGYLEVALLGGIVDITSEIASQTSATAADTSDFNAGVSAGLSASEAAASTAERLLAETARQGAEDAEDASDLSAAAAELARDEAVIARDDAEDAEAAASLAEGGAVTASGQAAGYATSAFNDAAIATAKATEAGDAATEAQTAQQVTSRLTRRGMSKDPTFSLWSGTYPDHFTEGGLTRGTVTKTTTEAKYTNAVVLTTTDVTGGSGAFIQLSGVDADAYPINADHADLILVTAEVELKSGSWGGAFIRTEWRGTTSKNTYEYLDRLLPPETGVIHQVEFITERPAGYVAAGDIATDYMRSRIHSTSSVDNGRIANEIIVHSMDIRRLTSDAVAAITQETKAMADGWSSSYLGFQTAVVGAETVMSLYAMNDSGVAVSGVTLATGTFLIESDMTVFKNGIVQSDNYAEDVSGFPTAGWQLDGANGTIKGKSVITTEMIAANAVTMPFFKARYTDLDLTPDQNVTYLLSTIDKVENQVWAMFVFEVETDTSSGAIQSRVQVRLVSTPSGGGTTVEVNGWRTYRTQTDGSRATHTVMFVQDNADRGLYDYQIEVHNPADVGGPIIEIKRSALRLDQYRR